MSGTPPTGAKTPDKSASDATGPLLFEVAWEVCSQVGGIYTVLRSKAPATVRRWGDGYCLIGPYWEQSARVELEPQAPPPTFKKAIDLLAVAGITAHFGRWLITGRPQAILIDVSTVKYRLAEIKYSLWHDNGVSSPDGDVEFDNVAAFGHAVCELLMFLQRSAGERPMLAHFHEWQGGAALPMLRHRGAKVATVFTTHATLVGRGLSAANADLYNHLGHVDAGSVASEHGFPHRHAIEGAAAAAADVFTTVSGITGLEARQFLGREPDALLPNGLNVERFAAPHEFQELHQRAKERINEFVMGHFFPSYTFDLDRTLYVFTSGRYEYRNKGLDVFIEALHELNQRMIAEGTDVTVVAFIITRAPYKSLNIETLNRQAMFNELRDTCEGIQYDMGRRLFNTVATGRMPTIDDLLDEYGAVRLKRMMYAALRHSLPPTIVTHDLLDDATDPVLRHLRHRGLWNSARDRVKIVFHPDFVSATSPLLAMDYDQFVHGCHMGVFPSYYEPWGYTPLECIIRGIPAITSDLSGFGAYVMENFPDHNEKGVYVAHRRHADFGHSVYEVANWMHGITRMTRRQRIDLRNQVEGYSDHFDWNNLGRYYVAAQKMAFERCYGHSDFVPADEVTDGPPRKSRRRRTTTKKRARKR